MVFTVYVTNALCPPKYGSQYFSNTNVDGECEHVFAKLEVVRLVFQVYDISGHVHPCDLKNLGFIGDHKP